MNSSEKILSKESLKGSQSDGWESVAAIANKSVVTNNFINPEDFEKPSENFDTISAAVAVYTRCDLKRKNSFYNDIMNVGTERWYPEMKVGRSSAKIRFEGKRFNEWKQNIINMDAQTAIKRFGASDTFSVLQKLHNYLVSGHDAPTQTELINNCFSGFDNELEIAFERLKYDRHSGGGWMYYSSRDEKLGLEERINMDGRLYLNAEPMDTFDIADKFVDACKEVDLPYEFKINWFSDRSDAMVFYINNKELGNYSAILTRILDENPKIKQRVGGPPLLTEKISDKIGYGDEKTGTSYNERQSERFARAIEDAAMAYSGPAPKGPVQERVKFLYTNFNERYLQEVKKRL